MPDVIDSPVFQTAAGTRYLTGPGVALIGHTVSCLRDTIGPFLAGFPELDYEDYLDDPDHLMGGEEVIKFAGQACFDPETEILSNRGWISVADVTLGDRVLTLNRTTNYAEWGDVLAVHSPQSPTLLRYENRELDLLVTPDHRFWGVWKGRTTPEFVTAAELSSTSRAFCVPTAAAGWIGEYPDSVVIPGARYAQRTNTAAQRVVFANQKDPVILDSPESLLALARLCVYYAAEGCLQGGSGGAITVYGNYADTVTELASTLGLPTSVHADPRSGCPQIRVGGGQQWREWFASECGHLSPNKRLPDWVLDLPKAALHTVLQDLVNTDGRVTNSGSSGYYTVSTTLAGQVQEIACKVGFATRVVVQRGLNYPMLHVSLKRRAYGTINSNHHRISVEPYTGAAYCVTTDNQVVYVRRGGKAYFSGNCYQSYGPQRTPNAQAGDYFDRTVFGKPTPHDSIAEHAQYTVYVWGVDRSLSHEWVRHRHQSPSQLSQRYVDGTRLRFVERPEYRADPDLHQAFCDRIDHAAAQYEDLAQHLLAKWGACGRLDGLSKTEARKAVNQAARSCLPNETETILAMSGNVRAWMHFFDLRASVYSDLPIRELAVAIHRVIAPYTPHILGRYHEADGPLGTTILVREDRR